MTRTLAIASLWSILAVPTFADAQDDDHQEAKSFEKQVTVTVSLDYLLYLPDGYADSDQKYPLMLFLHGAGESGDNLDKVKAHGPPKLIAEGKDFPFIVVSPQSPGRGWQPETLNALLDDLIANYRVDEDRIYLTGLSMGGFGTWSLAAAHPDRFAAIAPICGGGDPRNAEALKDLPIWVFHGAKDPTVPIESSQRMVDALKELDSDVKFTIYPEARHDSWTETYDNPELYKWFLSHSRGQAKSE